MISLNEINKLCEQSNELLDIKFVENLIATKRDEFNAGGNYYRLFYLIVNKYKPKTVVELGSFTGIATLCMSCGCKETKIISVDHKDRVFNECKRENIKYLVQDSLTPIDVNNIDILFIDTLHDGKHTKKEFEIYKNKMSNKHLIFFDDIMLNYDMFKFWDELNPDGYIKATLPIHGHVGFGVLIKNKDLESEGGNNGNNA